MKLIIDIPDKQYELIKQSDYNVFSMMASKECMMNAIKIGTPLPKGNGRLIDADELLKAIDTWDKFGYTAERNLIRLNQDNQDMYVAYIHFDDSVNCIKNMPTIIPADKEESK
jgi:hypothetical protein